MVIAARRNAISLHIVYLLQVDVSQLQVDFRCQIRKPGRAKIIFFQLPFQILENAILALFSACFDDDLSYKFKKII